MAKIIEIKKKTQEAIIIKILDDIKKNARNSSIASIFYDAGEKTLFATDGKVLLLIRTSLLERNGIDYNAKCTYSKNILIVDEYDKKLIDYKRAIPQLGYNGYDEAIVIEDFSNLATSWILFNLARKGMMVDYHYMDSIKGIIGIFSHFTWNNKKNTAPILLMNKDDSIKYIIMPCNPAEAKIIDAKELI